MTSPRKISKPVSSQPQSFAPSNPVPTPSSAPGAGGIPSRSEVKGSGTSAKAASSPRSISQGDIARRAFEIYAGRGYAPGDPVADWLEAERQLKAGL